MAVNYPNRTPNKPYQPNINRNTRPPVRNASRLPLYPNNPQSRNTVPRPQRTNSTARHVNQKLYKLKKKKRRISRLSLRNYFLGLIAGIVVFGIAAIIMCNLILNTVTPML